MARRPEPGFALLVVLWWTVLLALLGTQLAAVGRLEVLRAGHLRQAAMAGAAAAGVLQDAIFHMLDGSPERWAPGGAVRAVAVPGGIASVRIESEAAKIGLNVASARLIAALLDRLDIPSTQAAKLADAILDWRTAGPVRRALGAKRPDYQEAGLPHAPPEADFETLDELDLVRGMPPGLVSRLRPYLSVYQTGDPDLSLADPIVRLAWYESGVVAGEPDAAEQPAAPVLVTVAVELQGGGRVVRRWVIRLVPDLARRPYQILAQD